MSKNLIKVGDFYYDSRKNAALAENELRAVEYMRENLDLDKPDELFAAYQQMIERQIFKTEVGLDFLRDIREYLSVYATLASKLAPLYPIEETAVTKRNIKPNRSRKEERRIALKTSRSDEAIDPKKARKAAVEVLSGESAARIERKQKRKSTEKKDLSAGIDRTRDNPDLKESSKKNSKENSKGKSASKKSNADDKSPVSYVYRELFYLTLTLCIVLAIALGCMFYISSTSDNINILNYENELINRYATWEQELSDKQKELDSFERQLKSSYPQ